METIKVLFHGGDVAAIACPFCLETRRLSVEQISGLTKRALKIKKASTATDKFKTPLESFLNT